METRIQNLATGYQNHMNNQNIGNALISQTTTIAHANGYKTIHTSNTIAVHRKGQITIDIQWDPETLGLNCIYWHALSPLSQLPVFRANLADPEWETTFAQWLTNIEKRHDRP